jgi:hypothetical protein
VTPQVVHPIPLPPFPPDVHGSPRTPGAPVETAKAGRVLGKPVYPYRNRFRWFVFGRYSHLMRACRDHRHGLKDKVLDARLVQMRTWNSARFFVAVLLAVGIVATLVSAYVNQLPGAATAVVRIVIASSTAATGALSLAYFFLTRLLGQLEIDILALLTLEHQK